MSDATLSGFRPDGTLARVRSPWRSSVLELVLMLGLALALDEAFLEGDRFWAVQPHPFWIPVLLLAVQYGTNAGLLAAGAASAALLIGNLPPQEVDQDHYAYLFAVTWQPLLWLAAALIVGELRTRQVRDRHAWCQMAARLRDENATISAAYEQLKDVKERIEGRLASQQNTTAGLATMLRELEEAQGEEALLAASRLLRSALNAGRVAVYTLQGDAAHLIHDDGSATAAATRPAGPDPALLQAIAGQRRVVSLLRPDEAPLLGDTGLMAGPLTDGAGGRVIGLVVVNDVDLTQLSETAVQLFALLLRWIGPAIARGRLLPDPQAHPSVETRELLLS